MNALTLESAITAASALQTSLASPDAAARATDRMDQRFLEMLRLYRTRGGLAREEEVMRRMGHCASRPRRDCEPGHAHDSVIRLAWGGTAWLPLFQFCKEDMTVRAETARVVIELAPVFDGWAIAEWVTAPNSWLLNRPPIDVLDSHIQAVIDAARADRFIAE